MLLRRSVLGLLLIPAALFAQRNADWDKPFPPHKVAGNIYYVGSEGLSSYLITTPQGHILINSSFERTVPLIRKAVEVLGFKFSDVKILLTSHAHGDHAEGTALIKELTGAKIMVMQGDEGIVESGGQGDFQYTGKNWKPCKVDRVLKDGDEVKLGGSTLVARHTPGHTRGCTTWTTKVRDQGKELLAVVVGSPNVNPGYQLVGNVKYPAIAEDYARSFRIWNELKADIFLGAHGAYYDMPAKYEKLKKGEAGNPFIDPHGYRAYIADREKAYQETLAKQQKMGAGK
jgi:metallo-beta-lactamase class B